jgi:hypothetical protein
MRKFSTYFYLVTGKTYGTDGKSFFDSLFLRAVSEFLAQLP